MALISAKTIITSLSLFHITLGFFFLTSPITIADQALVYIIGEAMGMPYSRAFESQSPALAFLAVILAILGITDLVTLSLPEEIALVHLWGTQAPLRFLISFGLVSYTLAFSPSSPLYSTSSSSRGRLAHPSAQSRSAGYVPSNWGGDGLKNRVFFAFAFIELMSWFWVWVTLREEKREIAVRKAQRRRSSHGAGGAKS
ncbi:Protein ILM1 [Pleurostoma richardsiae]|uniref:Protein ILM1 n=1 Tax=Pleurostoma richardsiae TaxID=41990 RepID=A0AA38VHL6_9PEZI|nr:Protein ILM1 [Pleurostoma richardsiae]